MYVDTIFLRNIIYTYMYMQIQYLQNLLILFSMQIIIKKGVLTKGYLSKTNHRFTMNRIKKRAIRKGVFK